MFGRAFVCAFFSELLNASHTHQCVYVCKTSYWKVQICVYLYERARRLVRLRACANAHLGTWWCSAAAALPAEWVRTWTTCSCTYVRTQHTHTLSTHDLVHFFELHKNHVCTSVCAQVLFPHKLSDVVSADRLRAVYCTHTGWRVFWLLCSLDEELLQAYASDHLQIGQSRWKMYEIVGATYSISL